MTLLVSGVMFLPISIVVQRKRRKRGKPRHLNIGSTESSNSWVVLLPPTVVLPCQLTVVPLPTVCRDVNPRPYKDGTESRVSSRITYNRLLSIVWLLTHCNSFNSSKPSSK